MSTITAVVDRDDGTVDTVYASENRDGSVSLTTVNSGTGKTSSGASPKATARAANASNNANKGSRANPVDHVQLKEVNVKGKRPAQGHGFVNGLYNKYYSSSDCMIYIEDIWLDKVSGIGINESLSSVPIYTIGNSRYSFLSRGNNMVTGFISINKCNKDYLPRVLDNINKTSEFRRLTPYEQMQLTSEELRVYKEKEAAMEIGKVSNKSVLDWADLDTFNITIAYNNGDPTMSVVRQYVDIQEIRIIVFETSVDIVSDGQLVDGYRFIAKEVRG